MEYADANAPGRTDLSLARLNSQPFSSLRPPAVKDKPAAFRSHADKESMGSFPACITDCF